MRVSIRLLTLLASIAVSSCAGYAPSKTSIGQDRATLIASMGQPERIQTADGFEVLHYPRGPSGSHTYFVSIDDNGRVTKWEQVLTEERFNTISPGMTNEQVIGILGITKITHGLARNRGYVWHYRYATPHCKSFVIEFTPDSTVRSAGYRIRSGRFCKYVGMG